MTCCYNLWHQFEFIFISAKYHVLHLPSLLDLLVLWSRTPDRHQILDSHLQPEATRSTSEMRNVIDTEMEKLNCVVTFKVFINSIYWRFSYSFIRVNKTAPVVAISKIVCLAIYLSIYLIHRLASAFLNNALSKSSIKRHLRVRGNLE